MSIFRLTTLGLAILLLTFAGSISPGAVLAQQASACATGGAVPDPDDNPGLVSDCETLLAARDTLAGTATLNWAADTPMSEWDGVSYQGTPERVTQVALSGRGLTGTIPTGLGNLSNLTTLDLGINQLTGEIPTELGNLSSLQILTLGRNPLSGEIPTELGNLSNLSSLILAQNQLSGEIPKELANLPNLEYLNLGRNQLTGEIPTELGNLSNLTQLILHANQLTGEIPTELGNLSNLTFMFLNNNQLTGELPQSLTGLTMLVRLHFDNNAGLCAPTDEAFQTWLQSVSFVSGDNCVPEDSAEDRAVLVEFYNSTNGANWADNTNWLSDKPMREWHGVTTDDEGRVAEVILFRNQLTGEIPIELGNLSALTRLSLSRNQLTGTIPTQLGGLSNLTRLFLYRNRLTGEIPTELGNLSNLTLLLLNNNQLTGELPQSLTGLTMLGRLHFDTNAGLCAPTDEAFQTWLQSVSFVSGDNCVAEDSAEDRAALVELYNATGGANWTDNTNWLSDEPMRAWYGVTTDDDGRVARLSLSENQLTGEIPTELGNLSNLRTLILSSNQLTGEIPTELGNLSNLQRLNLHDNQLTGELPQSLTGLTVLSMLSFNNNAGLCAPIDEAFQIWLLSVTSVRGSSCAPMDSAEDRAVLVELYNATDGANWTNNTNWLSDRPIREWHGVINDADGRVSDLLLGRNELTGEIPKELGSLSNLKNLYLHANQLTGEIPMELGDLSNLQRLILSSNQLTGEIPAELGNLTGLTILRLSSNQLTGEIPAELGNLTGLTFLHLANNQFTGCMQDELRHFSTIPANDLDMLGLAFCTDLPGSPMIDEVTSGTGAMAGTLLVEWSAPASEGISAITTYDLRYIETAADETDDANWSVVEDVWTTGGGALEYTLAGFMRSTQYDVQVRAVNEAGDGPWSATVTGTPTTSVCVSGGAVADATNTGLISDCVALLGARDTLAGTATLNWATDTSITQWEGVGLGGTPRRVTRLNLNGKDLSGMIPSVLGRLSMLTYLNLRSNEGLTGEIPSELGYLSNLRVLNLHSNSHSGSIPNLSGMTSLEELYLANNDLTGSIPSWLNGMTNMEELWLWGNSLTGTVPNLSGMTSLQKLKLANNMLTGGVPEASTLPPNMTWLIIDRNPFGGTIPDLSILTRLRLLWLHSNGLTGEIPEDDMLPASLDDLNLRDNTLTGEIPDLSNLDRLTRLRLHNNSLSGEVPATLGDLDKLRQLWLHNEVDKGLGNNSFTSIAAGLGNLSDTLIEIALNGNPWADDACVPVALANVAKNDYADAGLEVCESGDGS